VVGEFALLTPEHSRTQTLECVDAGILLQISYGQIEQLFFQNPKFGFYFLQLITRRLLQNSARLETELAQCREMLSTSVTKMNSPYRGWPERISNRARA
jgi:CRP/FNR family transcriptional regulator, cyclic AMP receptor protein